MKEEVSAIVSPQQAQQILANGGLQVTMEQATAILQFLDKMAQIALEVYMVKRQ